MQWRRGIRNEGSGIRNKKLWERNKESCTRQIESLGQQDKVKRNEGDEMRKKSEEDGVQGREAT